MRFGETLIVVLEHANEAIKLIDSPLISLGHICREVRLLFVKQILKRDLFGGELRSLEISYFRYGRYGTHILLLLLSPVS